MTEEVFGREELNRPIDGERLGKWINPVRTTNDAEVKGYSEEEIIKNQDENTQNVLKALEDLRVQFQLQLTEKDNAIKKLIADMAGLEEELTEKDKQIEELKGYVK